MKLREPAGGGDLFGRPEPSVRPRKTGSGQPRRFHLDPSETEALVRDLHRLSEICSSHDMDQAAALIEVAARVVEIRARLAPLAETDEDPSGPGLL